MFFVTRLPERYQRFRSGDQTVPFDEKVFESIVDGLKALADAFEDDTSILEPLELITAAMFSTNGTWELSPGKG